ncbi:cation channel sperm-associated protein 3-like [Lingula anatina]|uniref:Cation channel sperm-associated protein 3-like n=1 Tax=Lingula anatina TaxID=7574 RepID=A0A1S3IX81_LINAN|nr:cation channel sperm-associated protein 3-like [Lingula anatina]|eukprot:XP_013402648.1 cation channel sperm-associated protein 3-like [Lingula anatina]
MSFAHFAKVFNDPEVDLEDDVWAKKTGARWDREFHRFIRDVTESSVFNFIIMFTIVCNALCMALETDISIRESGKDLFHILDELFLAVYTIEFIMKLYAEPKGYWFSSYNLFDFAVLVISYVQIILVLMNAGGSGLAALRILRALRTLRTLRTVSFIRGLQVLVTALLDTIRKSVLNVVGLLLLLMFLFGIMGYYFFGYKDDADKQNWGSLDKAMLTLFSYVTVDGWTDIQESLDNYNMDGSRIYTIFFIFLGHFIFSNVMIGVIIMNISEATENYAAEQLAEREAALKHKKEFLLQRQHNEVKQMLEKQRRGKYSNFHEMVQEFEDTLRHDDFAVVSDISTNLIWLDTLLTSLDHMDNSMFRVQQLHFELCGALSQMLDEKLRAKYGT